MRTVVLVRHGETTWNREGRIQGWAASTLTERGRDQARAVGARLAAEYEVDRLVASDLPRTRETVSLIREAGLDLDPTFSGTWRERDFGEYQGRTKREIATEHPDYDPDGSLLAVPEVPGGESLGETRERVLGGWESLLADIDGETVAVVTHGGPIRAVLSAVTGEDLRALAREFSPENCGITTFEVRDGEAELVSRDDCAHLGEVSE